MVTSANDLGDLYADSVSKSKIWQVISASSVGTMIEWYDFYIFGSLAAVISPLFYPPGNDTFAYIAYLATFAILCFSLTVLLSFSGGWVCPLIGAKRRCGNAGIVRQIRMFRIAVKRIANGLRL